MLNVLGLLRTNLGSREIDLLQSNTAVTQQQLLPFTVAAPMAHTYGFLPEAAQEGSHRARPYYTVRD